ncbi:dual specificity protein phosphatase 21 [Leptinotarsa decemlineata]|uniref:dual specificity protein phosphatase 21 n=1 Tax=Leptinotarsa decemlineata TaxID=7539 RepID=UPI000C252B8C|nr:dual specificity protein phosphatase 21-like [Leptinotarsa decemlineata]
MEVQSIIIDDIQKLRENTVQNIFSESEDAEIRSSESSELILGQTTPLGNISELTESLILTSASNVNPQTLDSFNISCIISCAPELPESPLHDEVIYHKIEVIDSGCSRILQYFDPAADLIHQVSSLGGKTLVYCVAGVSRSASICLAYLMKYQKLSLLEAYNYVKLRRPRIKPNCGFFKQLIEYEKQLFGCNTVEMVFNEFVQMEIPDVYQCDYKVPASYVKKRCKNGRY